MSKIISCIDGSIYADSVCNLSAWAAKRIDLGVNLLYVSAPHYDVAAKGNLSGSIGLGAKSGLLKELSEMDEARGKLEQKKGQLILQHSKQELNKKGIDDIQILHRRGSLVETIIDLENEAELIVMGKRGEQAASDKDHLGSNLERVIRSIHKPILVTTKNPKNIKNFLIAYDDSKTAKKAVQYVVSSDLLKGLKCHLLMISESNIKAKTSLKKAEEKLKNAGFEVQASLQNGGVVEDVVSGYIKDNKIDLLSIGAYGHSKIRNLILGSTTTALIHKSMVPILLFR